MSQFDASSLQIVTAPHPALVLRAAEVPLDAGSLRQAGELGARMLVLMERGVGDQTGVGLAANQVGVLLRVIVLNVMGHKRAWREEPFQATRGGVVLINPVITHRSPDTCREVERCLSHPGRAVAIMRPASVTVESVRPDGTAVVMRTTGRLARVVQHEVDHLDGISIVDRVLANAT